MTQIFRPSINTFAKLSVLGGAMLLVLALTVLMVGERSPYGAARAGIAVEQPVRFSHELHSGVLNIGCRYCHGVAEVSPYAGIPDTQTCMTCHSQIATYSELLEPVRASYADGTPLEWNVVHEIADHVYFNHSAHVNNGIGCETCHGQVEQMPVVWQAESMTMSWCLNCHFAPENYVRPASEIYTVGWQPPIPQSELGPQLVAEYDIHKANLGDCSVCHR